MHEQEQAFPHPRSSRTLSNCPSHSNPAKVRPYKFHSRRATGFHHSAILMVTCSVVDVSKCPDIRIWEVSATSVLRFDLGVKLILPRLLVQRIQIVRHQRSRILPPSFVMPTNPPQCIPHQSQNHLSQFLHFWNSYSTNVHQCSEMDCSMPPERSLLCEHSVRTKIALHNITLQHDALSTLEIAAPTPRS